VQTVMRLKEITVKLHKSRMNLEVSSAFMKGAVAALTATATPGGGKP